MLTAAVQCDKLRAGSTGDWTMGLILGKLYIALRSAGASEEQAQAAAAEVFGYENRWTKIESDLTIIKWMLAFNLATTMAILFKVFS